MKVQGKIYKLAFQVVECDFLSHGEVVDMVVGIREANLPYQFVNKLNLHILYKYSLTVLLFIFVN